jgi:transcriptional regulator with GAF, ATPase, and Fis domain
VLSLEEHERRYICEVLDRVGWVIGGQGGAATLLQLHESTLRNRMKKLGIERP